MSELPFQDEEDYEWIDLFVPWRFRLQYDRVANDSSYRFAPDEFYWMRRRLLRFIHTPRVIPLSSFAP